MSKNYELLRQADRARGLFQSAPTALASAVQGAPAALGQTRPEDVRSAYVPAKVASGWLGRLRGKARAGNGSSQIRRLDPRALARAEELKLVQRLFLSPASASTRMVVFCGVEIGDGSGRICTRAAETLASQINTSVCLVDANLQSPSLHRYFRLENSKGFAEAVLHTSPVTAFAQQIGASNLWLMPSGSLSSASNLFLPPDLVRARIAELRAQFDHVLINSSAANVDAMALLLGQLSDGVVLILQAHNTRREKAVQAKQCLEAADVKMLGTVLDQRTFPIPDKLYHRI